MAGIYIHIPFCKQACVYCDFHFSTNSGLKADMVRAIMAEAGLRKDFLPKSPLQSLYFGGGTPSLLSADEVNRLVESMTQLFGLQADAEITLEANPDDLKESYLKELRKTPVNRLSIGVQSFDEEDLRFMKRAHTAEESQKSLQLAQDLGFENLTIDLIYGLPAMDEERWQKQLEKMATLSIPHFSAYALTVEPKTELAHQISTGKRQPLDEEMALQHFQLLQKFAAENDYQHYELSNFCQPGREAVHNCSYWFGEPYLGLGPSAHSFRGSERCWNVANNHRYIKAINDRHLPLEKEQLSTTEAYNERVMTRLRLAAGLNLQEIETDFGKEFLEHCMKEAEPELKSGRLKEEQGFLKIPAEWRFHSDGIAAGLFWV